MTQTVGDALVRAGRRWRLRGVISSRRKLFENGDKLKFEWVDATRTTLKLTAYFPDNVKRVLGEPLILKPDGKGKFVAEEYGRKMSFYIHNSNAKYAADFKDGDNNNPDEGGDTDPD